MKEERKMLERLKEFIKAHENWKDLLESAPYNLSIKEKDDFFLFKYNQLYSDMSLPEVQEARGIIFRKSDWKCVRRAFDKFFNYGETNAATLDWAHGVSVQEKIDGTLVSAWMDENDLWHLSTNGNIDLKDAPTGNVKYPTFYDIFLEAIHYNSDFFAPFQSSMCYTFELVSPINRVVVPYENFELYLIGMRDMRTMEEMGAKYLDCEAEFLGVKRPKIYEMNSLEEVIEAAQKLPWDEEGYVVCDKNFNRIKVKSPQYLIAHYNRNNGNISSRTLMRVILENQDEEFLTYCEDYKKELEELRAERRSAIRKIHAETIGLLRASEGKTRKEFALMTQDIKGAERKFLFDCFELRAMSEDFDDWARRKNWNEQKWLDFIERWKDK